MNSTVNLFNLLPDSGYVCRVIPRLFSKTACAALLADSIKRSFQQSRSHHPTSYRNNDRLVVDDEGLYKQVFLQ
jgi:hypothetical protein